MPSSTLFSWTDGARGGRAVTTSVRYPAGSGPYPLLVFSPGFLASYSHYDWFLDDIADQGYVVACPNHVDTVAIETPTTITEWYLKLRQREAKKGDPFYSILTPNRCQDITFVIDQLALSVLAGITDFTTIGVAGHSYGARTALHICGVPVDAVDYSDARVGYCIAMSVSDDRLAAPDASDIGSTPAMFWAGSYDLLAPAEGTYNIYDSCDAGDKYYLQLLDAGHFVFTDMYADRLPASLASWFNLRIKIFCRLFVNGYLGDSAIQRALLNGVYVLQQAGRDGLRNLARIEFYTK